MKYGIKEEYWKKLCELFAKKPKIEKVILYGSRAKGTYKPFSDIDITLLGDKLEHDDLLDIIDSVDDLLLPYMFDISLYSSLKNESLIEHINRVGVEVYSLELRNFGIRANSCLFVDKKQRMSHRGILLSKSVDLKKFKSQRP